MRPKKLVNEHLTAIFDLDRIAYKASAAGEKSAILVKNKKEGIEKEFSTRTEFWGSKRSRDGGWLGEYNEGNKPPSAPISWEEFEIEDIQYPSPLQNVLHTAKVMIEKDLKRAGTKKVKFYLGMGEDYRLLKSTLMKYKGNRDETIKPVHLGAVKDYLIKKYSPVLVKGIEVDDLITEEAYKREDRFVIANDKDAMAQPTKVFNPDKPELGIIDCNCLGEIRKEKSEVKGYGRKFLYWQILYGDDTDNYRASKFSDINFGKIAAYKLLVDCTTDRECWLAMIDGMKKMYPEPKKVVGWRGDEFTIDWLYVLNEMFQMARMRRYEGDELHAKDMLDKLKIKY